MFDKPEGWNYNVYADPHTGYLKVIDSPGKMNIPGVAKIDFFRAMLSEESQFAGRFIFG
jgi:hypothetical protein